MFSLIIKLSKKTTKIKNEIVYSNTLISLGAAALCTQVFLLNDLETNWAYCVFAFFSTMISYNLQRLVRIEKLEKSNPKAWVVLHKKKLWVYTGISTIIALISIYLFFNLNVVLWLIPLAVTSLLYTYKDLRDIPFIKIFLISISWGIACGVLPFLVSNEINYTQIAFNFTSIFLYIFAITIPFDIRDKALDEKSKRTIPQIFGTDNAKIVAYISLVFYLIISIYSFPFFTLPFLLSVISAGGLIYFSTEKRADLYYSFWIDGHIILQFFVIMLIYFSKYA